MILTYLEHRNGWVETTSLEALTFARELAARLGQNLQAIVIGPGGDQAAGVAGEYGAEVLHIASHDLLDDFAPEGFGMVLHQLASSLPAVAVVGPGGETGNEVMAHLAALAGLPLAANCLEAQAGEPFTVKRIRWGGSLIEEASLEASIKLLTVAEHAVNPQLVAGPPASITTFAPTLDAVAIRTKVRERVVQSEGVTLTTARVVVSGGRGVGSVEGFAILEELARQLGGVVGCSRVVTNNGWRPHSDQVGQTGTRVAPDLYIACGISGAIQHWVGCKAAKKILAINTDSEAPMVTKADYAIIGDLHQIIPAISAELRALEQV